MHASSDAGGPLSVPATRRPPRGRRGGGARAAPRGRRRSISAAARSPSPSAIASRTARCSAAEFLLQLLLVDRRHRGEEPAPGPLDRLVEVGVARGGGDGEVEDRVGAVELADPLASPGRRRGRARRWRGRSRRRSASVRRAAASRAAPGSITRRSSRMRSRVRDVPVQLGPRLARGVAHPEDHRPSPGAAPPLDSPSPWRIPSASRRVTRETPSCSARLALRWQPLSRGEQPEADPLAQPLRHLLVRRGRRHRGVARRSGGADTAHRVVTRVATFNQSGMSGSLGPLGHRRSVISRSCHEWSNGLTCKTFLKYVFHTFNLPLMDLRTERPNCVTPTGGNDVNILVIL